MWELDTDREMWIERSWSQSIQNAEEWFAAWDATAEPAFFGMVSEDTMRSIL